MRKLTLDMEALEVESFVIEVNAGIGTVRGNEVEEGDNSALVGSCQQTCQFGCPGALQGTYGCGGGTAGGVSCAYSCQANTQCQNTCANTCNTCGGGSTCASMCIWWESCGGEGYSCGAMTGCTG